jgi:hypothetical protein
MKDIEYQKITIHDHLGEPTVSPFLNEITPSEMTGNEHFQSHHPSHENGHSSKKYTDHPHSPLQIDTSSPHGPGGDLIADISLKQKYHYWKNYFQSMPLFGACVNFVNSIVGAGSLSPCPPPPPSLISLL